MNYNNYSENNFFNSPANYPANYGSLHYKSKFDKYDPFLNYQVKVGRELKNSNYNHNFGKKEKIIKNSSKSTRSSKSSKSLGYYNLLNSIPLNKNYDLFEEKSKIKYIIQLIIKILIF